MADEPRCGFVALIGAPNVGKSTLINALVGAKVSIVTPKVQTTRMPVRGIAIAGETQIDEIADALAKSRYLADGELRLIDRQAVEHIIGYRHSNLPGR